MLPDWGCVSSQTTSDGGAVELHADLCRPSWVEYSQFNTLGYWAAVGVRGDWIRRLDLAALLQQTWGDKVWMRDEFIVKNPKQYRMPDKVCCVEKQNDCLGWMTAPFI